MHIPRVPFPRAPELRPLAASASGAPLPAPLQASIVRVFLHAMDGDELTRSEERRLVRHVARELGLATREARARVADAVRQAPPLHGLREALAPEQRVHLLASSFELARASGRLDLFDRLSAPLLARWLDLSASELATARGLMETPRSPWRLPRWRAA